MFPQTLFEKEAKKGADLFKEPVERTRKVEYAMSNELRTIGMPPKIIKERSHQRRIVEPKLRIKEVLQGENEIHRINDEEGIPGRSYRADPGKVQAA